LKKRIFTLLIAVVMMLDMSLTAFADQNKYYEGTGVFWFDMSTAADDRQGVFYANYIRLERTEDYDDIIFSNDSESHHIRIDKSSGYYVTDYNGVDYTYLGDMGGDVFDFGLNGGATKISYGDGNEYFYINMEFDLVETTTLTPHQITTAVSGSTTSDSGSYLVTVAGYLTAELTNGTHALSASDIASQSIVVVVVNLANGEVNILNQSSIDEITVTVSGGAVDRVVITGTAQTASSSSDTYTVTINP